MNHPVETAFECLRYSSLTVDIESRETAQFGVVTQKKPKKVLKVEK